MAKRIEIDGAYYRIRRGKMVEIPKDWLGQVPTKQTIRKRKEAARLKKNSKARTRKGQGEYYA